MKFFLDTANVDEIRKAMDYGMLDGVTTNPSLMAKENRPWKEQAEEICRLVDGPVSLEVVGTTAETMVEEARELVKFGPNVVVKIPMLMEGLKAVRILKEMQIPTNMTLIFSPMQAMMAAKAGAGYVSPFVGRLDDAGHDGMAVVSQIMSLFDNYALNSEVLVASVRSISHVQEAALLGADIATVP
ncbi:MAG TPA: fructose-6-phosphate aldolase, partial [Desulfomicrobiaceae bacterium]|nr:fructose-6-phosphate aldolase [Desulfomicrobiaceae bacterium]